jgi:hypothetical protein
VDAIEPNWFYDCNCQRASTKKIGKMTLPEKIKAIFACKYALYLLTEEELLEETKAEVERLDEDEDE